MNKEVFGSEDKQKKIFCLQCKQDDERHQNLMVVVVTSNERYLLGTEKLRLNTKLFLLILFET
jgi:hypothetical protein